jgi:hypothetical protein
MIPTLIDRGQIFLAACFVIVSPVLNGATIINGGNLTTTSWTLAGSPYVIMGDVAVLSGAKLTIEAGVEIRCASADAQGAGRDPLRVELTINGELDVEGTAASPVIFRGQTASAGSWYGIVIRNGASFVTLDHTVIQNAVTGLTCESLTGVQANNLTISTNQTAIVVNAGTAVLNQLTAFVNQTAVNVGGSGGVSAVRSVIYGNAVQAFQINPTAASAVTINHCTLHGNGTYGVYVGSASRADVTIRNTIITGNSYGVYRLVSPAGTTTVTYSDVWGNGSNYVNVVAGTGVISADPLFIDANGADDVFGTADDNLRLQPNTPCAYRSDAGRDISAYENLKLVILRPEFVGDDVRFRILSIPNRLHQLQFTENFSTWTTVATNLPGMVGSIYMTNFGVRSLPKRFYRVRLD